jgi:hypothetical protein
MSYEELVLLVRKARRLKELRRAKERVQCLERELRGESAPPEVAPYVPEFLRVRFGTALADRANANLPCLQNERDTLPARSRHLVELLPERRP